MNQRADRTEQNPFAGEVGLPSQGGTSSPNLLQLHNREVLSLTEQKIADHIERFKAISTLAKSDYPFQQLKTPIFEEIEKALQTKLVLACSCV